MGARRRAVGGVAAVKVLVTGNDGYIGHRLVPLFVQAGHEVVGLDSMLYEGCSLGPDEPACPQVRADIRDVRAEDLQGYDAVVHLAGISNDPLGNLDPEVTEEVNHRAAVALARAAKAAGVPRFLFSSSCSLYGAAGQQALDESAAFNPVTPYGFSKLAAEQGITALADDDFHPTYLRNATAYGASPRLRGDLVVNNLTCYAITTGAVSMKSDGMPWRPLVHIEDIGRAFLALAEAPLEVVHDRAFNVGISSENYRVRQVAEIVAEVVAGSEVSFLPQARPDIRNYKVDCDLIQRLVPAFRPVWTVRAGVEELQEAFGRYGLSFEDFTGPRYLRDHRVRERIAQGSLTARQRVVLDLDAVQLDGGVRTHG